MHARRSLGPAALLAMLVGCGSTSAPVDAGHDSGGDAPPAVDGGTDAGASTDAMAVDAGPGRVWFETTLHRTVGSGTEPVEGARICELDTTACADSTIVGLARISLPAESDTGVVVSYPGHTTFVYLLHTGTEDISRPGLGLYTEDEDASYFAASGGAPSASAAVTLRFEATATLPTDGQPGVTVSVLDDPATTLLYANAAATALDPALAETSIAGLAGASGLSAGTLRIVARGSTGTPCRPFFGGYLDATADAGTDVPIALPIRSGVETRFELRCAP